MLTSLLSLLSRDRTDLDVITSAGVLCGQCVSFDDAVTSFCCQEVPEMESIRCTGVERLPQCFTQHEAFKANTSVWTLHSVHKHYRRRHIAPATQEGENRYGAYSNIVFWMWGKLGKDVSSPFT